jgi:DNA-binding transcriptional MerR regulator
VPDDPFSLAELARLADVTPRTIRYYVAQGLLPSPEAAGPATRYGEGHLARLRLIRRLQRDHLPLAEIRGRLERLGDEDVQALLDATGSVVPEPSQVREETLSYVRTLMATAGVSPRVVDPGAGVGASATPAVPVHPPPAVARLNARTPTTISPPPGFFIDPAAAAPGAASSPRPATGDRSTWERLALSPDVELHVRRPLDRVTNKRVDQLTRIARELFGEEP